MARFLFIISESSSIEDGKTLEIMNAIADLRSISLKLFIKIPGRNAFKGFKGFKNERM